eukprot:CAMPEP_0203798572 /NCGR_PEP_ID=MMETSP0100_2-20121128/9364_1 /ASSEMBLY_ACC=CAM_ASM_000210 /TAXON_ID=96639 /ORGANISM=" , Strain NY0313808BC1" /LENGTH=237 /DNA_ID=CAMNT_0050704215 /DNA_START=359 /DNA_END=1070 /DNA_ORIENTATION=-
MIWQACVLLVILGCLTKTSSFRYKDEDFPDMTGASMQIPPLGTEDVGIMNVVNKSLHGGTLNFVAHSTSWTNMDMMTEHVANTTGHQAQNEFSSWKTLKKSMVDPAYKDAWGTAKVLHANNVTINRVVQVIPARFVTRCHVMSSDHLAYCHKNDGYFQVGWAYFAFGRINNSGPEYPLGLMCHAWDDSVNEKLPKKNRHKPSIVVTLCKAVLYLFDTMFPRTAAKLDHAIATNLNPK